MSVEFCCGLVVHCGCCSPHLLTRAALYHTFILGFDQSDGVVDLVSDNTPLPPGGLLVNLRQVPHVPALGLHLPPLTWVPPGSSVLRQGSQQRGEDAAVRVGELVRGEERVGGGRDEQRHVAVDQKQQQNTAEAADGGGRGL